MATNGQPELLSSVPSTPLNNEARFPKMPIQAPFRLDEGYSEETRSQSGSEAGMKLESFTADEDSSHPTMVPDWVLTLSEAERSELAFSLIQTLRTSSVASLVARLTPRLHLDPVAYLPPEITSEVLSYLDPQTILRASMVSRAWRDRTMESRLWKQMYCLEGWAIDVAEVRSFEDQRTSIETAVEGKPRSRRAETDASQQTQWKRIQTGSSSILDPEPGSSGMQLSDEGNNWNMTWNTQHEMVEADNEDPYANTESLATVENMEGVNYHASTSTSQENGPSPNTRRYHDSLPSPKFTSRRQAGTLLAGDSTMSHQFGMVSDRMAESVTMPGSFGLPTLNWHYLFKQRKRLEDNWNAGRFTNFQLPHPDHMDESHRECVYTIQYSGKYLVSGSRDRTIRIWNLDTRRLVRKPLVGHRGSVLCLQFDERPDHDIVVSGSSDTDVIIWRFSTGEVIKKIESAHGESVLNLRFDDRYLVTCSKDRTIKVWNRAALMPNSKEYPARTGGGAAEFPAYIIDRAEYMADLVNNPFSRQDVQPLPAFSLLMVLKGHCAAVNAIQVYEDRVVSASGDRTVKIWNLHTGECSMTVVGHMKGIACVQFDGRRIVSGSSDNTVRIFDGATGAEVACLLGHNNLVRTIQAGFGDIPGTEEDLIAEAREVDRRFFQARLRGEVPTEPSRRGRRNQANVGSRDPKDILGYGMRLPPGGGGSRWARIVSGSYDETVIVWRRDADGKWVVGNRLRQDRAARAAGGGMSPAEVARIIDQVQANPTDAPHAQGVHHPGQSALAPSGTGGLSYQAATLHAGNVHNINSALLSLAQQGIQGPQAVAQALQLAQASTYTTTTDTQNVNQPAPLHPPSTDQAQSTAPSIPQLPAQPQDLHNHAHYTNLAQHLHHTRHSAAANLQPNSRVFKLQFDARRIICCSQDPRIVGWDFANGDEEIIEASRFFAAP